MQEQIIASHKVMNRVGLRQYHIMLADHAQNMSTFSMIVQHEFLAQRYLICLGDLSLITWYIPLWVCLSV